MIRLSFSSKVKCTCGSLPSWKTASRAKLAAAEKTILNDGKSLSLQINLMQGIILSPFSLSLVRSSEFRVQGLVCSNRRGSSDQVSGDGATGALPP